MAWACMENNIKILCEWDGTAWTGLIWLRIRTSVSLL
jgi:hypothetical protein